MLDFTFISDEAFRSSIASDYQELLKCKEAGSWKSMHVLAGSIVEALLIEYLVVSGIRPAGKDPLTLALHEAIQACQGAGVIQRSTASLCDVIRDYRNLIHPGRVIRLEQNVSPEGANIALNLVTLIAREVAQKRKATYGPTAEQLLKKLHTDQHSLAVFPQLLTETNGHEKFKLVDTLIPEAFAVADSDPFSSDVTSRLQLAYRQAVELLAETEKAKIAEKFPRLIRQDSADQIQSYGDAFFVAEDIAYLQPHDAAITVKYLVSRLERPVLALTPALSRTTRGIGNFIALSEISKLADTLVRFVLRQNDAKAIELASEIFNSVSNDDKKEAIEKRGDKWVEIGTKAKYSDERMNKLHRLSAEWITLPF